MSKRWAMVGLVIGLVSTLLLATRPSQRSSYSSDTASRIFPTSLARLVEASSVIVVARYRGTTPLGVDYIDTPMPTPTPTPNSMATSIVPPTQSPPDGKMEIVGTEVVVDSIIKNNGHVEQLQSLMIKRHGPLPASETDLAFDAESTFPFVWPEDTEFVLFLAEDYEFESNGHYYIPYGACGRILTGEEQVTCSDGTRSILAFMSGLSGEDFIAAVEDEVNNPSPTATPYPTSTP